MNKPPQINPGSTAGDGQAEAARIGKVDRKTKETAISVSVNLDGTGAYDVETGIGFLDHMLEQLSRHSLIDISLRAKGDLHIDFHHTTEDSGLALGQAVAEALGDRAGIRRYGSALIPMDETLSRVALDASNRPYLIWKVNFTPRQARRHGHRVVQGVVSGFCTDCWPDASRREHLWREQPPYHRVVLQGAGPGLAGGR